MADKYIRNMRLAFLGLVGAVFFMAGDCLIFCKAGLTDQTVEPLWAQMAEQRFIISTVLGFIGMVLMLPAWISFRRMIADTCKRAVCVMTDLSFIGVVSTGYLHFAYGSLLPLTYKAVLGGGGDVKLAGEVCEHIWAVMTPVNIVLTMCLCMIFAVHFYVTVSGRSGLKRFSCLLGILGAFAVGLLWRGIFGNSAIGGAYGAFESLGEGLTYLTASLYWRKRWRTA